ncbi:MAG: putative sigma 54 modulation protein/ribosomal protein [Holophagaceae bacterium]|nr:putative sigma 54 modulation protein/ribosomal protein [Holophagaceae bacterium]HLP31509.1 HPF/RaiA family ribosome-associated protein [Geothrix sp.]
MNIQIRGIGIPQTEALTAHIQRSLAFALSRFATRLDRVVVRFSDLNGPKGGCDKVCRVGFTLKGAGTEAVEARDLDLYSAVDQAAAKAGRRVARLVEQARG